MQLLYPDSGRIQKTEAIILESSTIWCRLQNPKVDLLLSGYLHPLHLYLYGSYVLVLGVWWIYFLDPPRGLGAMLYYAMLYYTVIYYTILYYTILYYTILYYTRLD